MSKIESVDAFRVVGEVLCGSGSVFIAKKLGVPVAAIFPITLYLAAFNCTSRCIAKATLPMDPYSKYEGSILPKHIKTYDNC
jgi:hypothetical protein